MPKYPVAKRKQKRSNLILTARSVAAAKACSNHCAMLSELYADLATTIYDHEVDVILNALNNYMSELEEAQEDMAIG